MRRVVDSINDRYDLVSVIGEGGMGQVYRARDRTLRRTVAVKVLRVELSSDPFYVERFHREAIVLGQVQHPNVVALID